MTGAPGTAGREGVLLRPLSAHQRRVAAMLATGLPPKAIAPVLGVKRLAVYKCIERIAAKLPGDLPAETKVLVWARGAPQALFPTDRLPDEAHLPHTTRPRYRGHAPAAHASADG